MMDLHPGMLLPADSLTKWSYRYDKPAGCQGRSFSEGRQDGQRSRHRLQVVSCDQGA